MIICTRCKAENVDGAKFCGECGNDLTVNVDAPSQEDLRELAEKLNEKSASGTSGGFNMNGLIIGFFGKIGGGFKKVWQAIAGFFKKLGLKRLIFILSAIVILSAGTFCTVKFVVPYAPHYFEANKAVKSGDYKTAIAEYELAGGFLNTETKLNDARYLYAQELFDKKDYYNAANYYKLVTGYDDTADKLILCAEGLITNDKFDYVIEVLEYVTTEKAEIVRSYAKGRELIKSKDYEDAKACFVKAGDYRDAKTFVDGCQLMSADELCFDGDYDGARAIYSSLPADFEFNGVKASDRIATLDRSQTLINAMGEWTASDNYIETKNVYKRDGSWDSWYHGHDNVLSGQDLKVECSMNADGTFNISGSVSFYAFDDYSSLSEYCRASKTSRSIDIYNVTQIPSSFSLSDYTTLYFSNGVFSIKYSEKDNYSSYFYNMYNSSVTYGNRK